MHTCVREIAIISNYKFMEVDGVVEFRYYFHDIQQATKITRLVIILQPS